MLFRLYDERDCALFGSERSDRERRLMNESFHEL